MNATSTHLTGHSRKRGAWLWISLVVVTLLSALVYVRYHVAFAERNMPPLSTPDQLRQAVLLRDEVAMRTHGWAHWARITSLDSDDRPAWSRWHAACETLGDVPCPKIQFEPARQLAEAVGQDPRLAVSVYYNTAAHKHIRDQFLYKEVTLESLYDNYKSNNKPTSEFDIKPFPPDAIAIKAAWLHIRHGEVSDPIPVYDSQSKSTRDVYLAPGDPNHPVGHPYKDTVIESISKFYTVTLGEHTENLKTALAVSPEYRIKSSDYVILVGMHVATKELQDWVWITYWWNDNATADRHNRAEPVSLMAPWTNYLMDITLDAEIPVERTPQSGYQNICYNPWLEKMTDGSVSNCVACHQKANWTKYQNPDRTGIHPNHLVDRGKRSKSSDFYRHRLRLDYMWSLARHQHPSLKTNSSGSDRNIHGERFHDPRIGR